MDSISYLQTGQHVSKQQFYTFNNLIEGHLCKIQLKMLFQWSAIILILHGDNCLVEKGVFLQARCVKLARCYLIYFKGDFRRYFHRIIADQVLGRSLKTDEVVHHIDGNPSNNKIGNLMLFSDFKIHFRFHRLFKKLSTSFFPYHKSLSACVTNLR